jgi:hypothetical protein
MQDLGQTGRRWMHSINIQCQMHFGEHSDRRFKGSDDCVEFGVSHSPKGAPSRRLHIPTNQNPTMAAAPPPQTFPYDHLFKILVIGDAGVGKVSLNNRF